MRFARDHHTLVGLAAGLGAVVIVGVLLTATARGGLWPWLVAVGFGACAMNITAKELKSGATEPDVGQKKGRAADGGEERQ
jgi:hypothetical protein